MKNKNEHYVYMHIHPLTKEIFYIGRGTPWRAYIMDSQETSSKRKVRLRSKDHNDYLWSLIHEHGYVPHHWVQFQGYELDFKQSVKLENLLIKKHKPRFNKEYHNPAIFDDDQIVEINNLYQFHQDYNKIADIMKCSRSTIYRIINKKRSTYDKSI